MFGDVVPIRDVLRGEYLHEGMWITYSELKSLAKWLDFDDDGKLKEICDPADVDEGMCVNIEGIWFEIFLFVPANSRQAARYFIERKV